MLDKSVLTPTWKVAILTAQNGDVKVFKNGVWFRPWRWFKSNRPFDTNNVKEVVAIKEDHTFAPRVAFQSVLKLNDGRFVYSLSVLNQNDGQWSARQYIAWSLQTLMKEAMTPDVVATLKLLDRGGKTTKKSA